MNNTLPLLEYDPNQQAVINAPDIHAPIEHSGRAVLCFFNEVLLELYAQGVLKLEHTSSCEMGPLNVYSLERCGQTILVQNPRIGAPFSAGVMEELIAYGSTRIVACGGAEVY